MRKLASYVKKYGEKRGRAMYRRLQREAALASAHARDKKSAAARALGAEGGKARAASLSKEALSEIGKAGAAKRWGK